MSLFKWRRKTLLPSYVWASLSDSKSLRGSNGALAPLSNIIWPVQRLEAVTGFVAAIILMKDIASLINKSVFITLEKTRKP